MITANYIHQSAGPDPSRRGMKRTAKQIEKIMSDVGGSVTSRTGFTASLAINICEVKGWHYSVQANPRFGYFVKRENFE